MAIVVTDNCRGCRFTECVSVCPVACFHADDEMVYIDPGVCIDCMACIPVCPVQAIFSADELPEDRKHWIAMNAERAATFPVIDTKQEPLPGAEERRAELGYAETSVTQD
ncbi:MAG: ferredoxin [Betaproteobacteria bacterium RIFCSPLOWO2_12_FULL_62_13]|nr:MAG: ferredoxin [Betaproteobacteria bacterium RIFCSPLOWO2_12_FULL_62_13]